MNWKEQLSQPECKSGDGCTRYARLHEGQCIWVERKITIEDVSQVLEKLIDAIPYPKLPGGVVDPIGIINAKRQLRDEWL